MKYRLLAFVAAIVLLSNFSALVFADSSDRNVKRAKSNQLVAMLPASDGVVTLDVQRFFNEALPMLLASQQPLMSDILSKIEKIQERTGIDVRRFDHLVAGINATPTIDKRHKLAAVMIARGAVDSSAIITSAKSAAKNKYKEESVGSRTMLIFSAKEVADDNAGNVTDPNKRKWIDKVIDHMSGDIAIAAIDINTIAFGQADRVRQALQGDSRVGTDITKLLDKKEFAVVNFAAKLPAGMSAFLPLESDDLGESIDSIRYAFGNMDSASGQLSLTARTEQISQARQLADTLEVLQILGKSTLSSSKRPDQQLYARLLEKAKFTRSGTDISLDLQIPQSDVDQLMAILIK
jgi:hypothetical protein